MADDFVCGIDFGTSNTAMSVIGRGQDQARLVALADGADTIPTAIFFPADAPQPLYGRAAVTAYREHHEGRFMRSLKRALGTSLMAEGTIVNGRRMGFEDIIAGFLAHIKTTVEGQLDAPLTHVVAGRPVHFVDNDAHRDAQAQSQLEQAFRRAGFTDIRFQFEPIAAAFAHESQLPDNREYLAAVLDIGGGTSDFSIIKLSQQYLTKQNRQDDVLGNAGIRLGGNDFDKQLSLRDYMPLLGLGTTIDARALPFPSTVFFDLSEWSRIPFVYAPKYRREVADMCNRANDREKAARLRHVVNDEYGHALLDQVEQAKITLSAMDQAISDLRFISPGLACAPTRTGFEAAIERECTAIAQTLDACTRQAGVKASDINLVILTGGGTGIPVVQDVARRAFPHARIASDNMLASVGLGLSYDAARLFL